MLTRNEDDDEEHQSVDIWKKKKKVEKVGENKNLFDISVRGNEIPIMDVT